MEQASEHVQTGLEGASQRHIIERRRLIACGVTVAVALVLLAAALFLEHVLRVPPEQLEESESVERGEV